VEKDNQRRRVSLIRVPGGESHVVGTSDRQALAIGVQIRGQAVTGRPGDVDSSDQHFELGREEQLLGLFGPWSIGSEMHHGVGMVVGEDVKHGNAADHKDEQDQQPSFCLFLHSKNGVNYRTLLKRSFRIK